MKTPIKKSERDQDVEPGTFRLKMPVSEFRRVYPDLDPVRHAFAIDGFLDIDFTC